MPYAASIAQRRADRAPHGIEGLLGEAAWQRLPEAVRTRFSEPAVAVDYVGEFEIVRASPLGRFIAWLCLLIGTPVVPRTGVHVPAVVRVGPTKRGVAWNREYRWPRSSACLVRSTKVIGSDGVVQARPVELGAIIDGLRVVQAGLTRDDLIAVDGLANPAVRPGAKVSPQVSEVKSVTK